MTISEAAEALRLRGVLDAEPVPSPELVVHALNHTMRYTEHAVSQAYTVGAKVVPVVGNGRVYRCVVAGTSAATVPAWPKYNNIRYGQSILDGTARWNDCGPAHDGGVYDLNAATGFLWSWRAQKLAELVDISDADAKIAATQRYKQALNQAARYGYRCVL